MIPSRLIPILAGRDQPTLVYAGAADLSAYTVYRGVNAVDWANQVGSIGAGNASIDLAGLGHVADVEYWYGVRATSKAGVQETNTDRIVRVIIDSEGNLIGPAPNAPLAASAKAIADAEISLTVVYSARGQAGVATGVQVAEVSGAGVPNWGSLITTVTVRSSGMTRRTVTLDESWADGETVRLAVRAATAAGATGDELLVNPVAVDATAPAAVEYVEAAQV